MRPLLLAIALLLHALAQAGVGMWAAGRASPWLVTPLWLVAICGFMAAAFAVFGLERLKCLASPAAAAAALASAILLRIAGISAVTITLFALGIGLAVIVRWWARCTHPEIHTPTTIVTGDVKVVDYDPPTLGRRVGAALAWSLLAFTAILVVVRPWHMSWGSTREERAASIPRAAHDEKHAYRIDHAVTVRAPAPEVWQWLAQVGQDRAGFYSYDWLERAIGDSIYNVDSLIPAWQEREVGDLVRATQPDYLGGIFGKELGWRVTHWDPPRAMVLESWGAFIVRPLNDSTSRLIVRTRGDGRPNFAALPLTPLGFYLLEPAHFIMERGMLLGIKERAERARAAS